MVSHSIARRAIDWHPPFEAIDRRSYRFELEVGMVVAHSFAAWEVTHVGPMVEADEHRRDMRATLHRLHGPKHEHENKFGDVVVRYRSTYASFDLYRNGRVYLCSCCGDPAPCRMQVAEESSALAAQVFEERLKRMGPGICYACGEVITRRQERVTFPGEHADFPGRGAPTFHTRQRCANERYAYSRRAGVDMHGRPLRQSEES